ncbi:prepilin-type N-terminal cleavage/methylation domain-containing protein [Spirochaetes bacterium]|uniref:Prepilin-type N-terminal cleavage/methylation domain-containing protein n=1 Tax=Candidatus Scatousia excrementipullorum TaxID=2840936 RepID=A0A9D9H0W9_9BACT|nr:prepilin-type N-terminal cleavage/methylation domain-containing protein [Candidatus Scatousia excrementipullorum]
MFYLPQKRAFTLAEVLVTLGIVGLIQLYHRLIK